MLVSTAALLLQLTAPAASQDARLLRDARTAQVRFEATRRMHLPRDWSGAFSSSGRCDARIGRYCYWYDSTESPALPEPTEIAVARAKLIAFLDSAAARQPEDGWVAGQRTRYLIEARRIEDAASAARECRAERWWCAALEGLALHIAERYSDADSVYARALREMSEAQRCQWLDIRLLVSEALSRELDRADCAQRAQFADRLWTLSQPLWSTRGNDLRTEHFARLTMAAILPRSANPHGMSWGDDSRELLLRYGWAEWFTRHESGYSAFALPTITGHDREPSYAFFPDLQSLPVMPRVTANDWNLRNPIARSRYAPRHIKSVTPLRHVLARFPRGDSMLVAVAFRVEDTALARDSTTAYLASYRRSRIQLAEAQERGISGISMMLPNDTTIVSIEVRGAATKRAARARYTIGPLPRGGAWSLSELLLFDPTKVAAADDLNVVLSQTFIEDRISASQPLGVYWELASPRTVEPVWINLTVERIHVGLARRLATRLHLARELAPVRLRWQFIAQQPRRPHSVSLRLPSTARGRYRVVLTVEPAAGTPLSASREIEVER